MMTEKNSAADERRIREIIEERVAAIREKDVEELLTHHAPDVLSFDVLDPLQNAGSDAIRQRAERWLTSYEGPPGYEVRDLNVTAGETVAFCRYLYRVSGTLKTGGTVDMWVRATVCFVKADGEWKIVHEHQSVPFDAQTGKASLNLKP
ncbi:MAG: nuclear transport factor 2 family protein [Pyrinomonadaceae bacterium]